MSHSASFRIPISSAVASAAEMRFDSCPRSPRLDARGQANIYMSLTGFESRAPPEPARATPPAEEGRAADWHLRLWVQAVSH